MEAIDAYRPGDVLHGLLTAELERERKFALDLIVGRAGKADVAAGGQTFQTGGDIHAVAVEPLALDDDVTEIDADSKPHLPGRRQIGVARLKRALNVDGTLDGVDDADKVRQDVVARRVHDAPAVAGDRGADDLAILRERADGPQLVLTHETAVAFHVSAQNRGKLALSRALVHVGEFYAR
jgi:hypothetical protein